MQLTLNSRFADNIYIIQCSGRIVLGPEVKALEAALDLGAEHTFNRFVLSLAEVTRLDSIGIGLLVRFAERLRRRGGDIRLAQPPPFLVKLLELTQLSKAVLSFPTEEEAILSFLRQPSPGDASRQQSGPRLLFIDESADLCVFVRTVLGQRGFDVRSSVLLRDAKLVLQIEGADYILAGPGTYQRSATTVLAALSPIAPKAVALSLPEDFKTLDAEAATATLLQVLKQHSTA
jgi:anti-anti-sigma factor